MNRITKIIAAAGTAVALAVGSVAIAGPPEGLAIQAIRELDLTPEQREQLKEIRESHRKDMEKVREQRESTMEIFREELLSDKPNEKRLHQLIDDREKDMMKRAHDRLDLVLEIHSVLTATQREALAEKLEEMREEFREERGRHHGPRRGR